MRVQSRLGDYKQTNKPKAFPRKRKDRPIKLGNSKPTYPLARRKKRPYK